MLSGFILGKIIICILVLFFAIEDYMYKSIDARYLVISAFAEAVIYLYITLWGFKPDVIEIFWGGFLGIVAFVISKLYRRFIGEGDGIFLGILGIAIGYTNLIKLLGITFFIVSIFSLIIIFYKVINNKSFKRLEFPLIPFVMAAYIILFI